MDLSGNKELLDRYLVAFFASRTAPPEALDLAKRWAHEIAQTEKIVISGFHSPIERAVLDILLANGCSVVVALGRSLYRKIPKHTYTVVPYMSPHIGISSDELVEETTEYFRNYNLNGITGSLTIFGDFGLPPAVQVELIDHRNPSKNGVYLVDEVTTNFGVGGYRQQLSIPYRVNSTTN